MNHGNSKFKTSDIFHLLSRLRDRYVRAMELELKKNGLEDLAPAHAGVLFVLSKQEPTTLSSLAESLDRDNSTLTTLTDKLQKAGYLKMQPDPADRRRKKVVRTAKGRSATAVITGISRRLLTRIYRGFSKEERSELTRLATSAWLNLA